MSIQYSDTWALLTCNELPFVDSSIDTRVLNTGVTLDTTVKKFGAGSARFDGVSSTLRVTQSFTNLVLEDKDFTIECWATFDGTAGNSAQLFNITGSSQSVGLRVSGTGGGTLEMYSGDALRITASGLTWAANTFYHIALVRSGTTITMYRDGVSLGSWAVGTASFATNVNQVLYIGTYSGSSVTWKGCIDDFRVVTNNALYTANFTPPAAELTAFGTVTAIPVTVDSSDFRLVGADASLPNSAPKLANVFANLYADAALSGTSKIIDFALPDAMPYGRYAAPTEDVSWVGAKGAGRVYGTLKIAGVPNVPVARRLRAFRDSDGKLMNTESSTPSLGEWEFVGLPMDDTYTVVAFDDTDAYRGVVADRIKPELLPLLLGGKPLNAASSQYSGYGIADISYEDFPFWNNAEPYFDSVALLLSMNGVNTSTTFLDTSKNNVTVTAYNGAQIRTAQSKFGGASGFFDGNGFIETGTYGNLEFPGDFTVELWVYTSSWSSLPVLFEHGVYTNGIMLRPRQQDDLYVNNVNFGSLGARLTDQWVHYAITRAGTTVRAFVNGTQAATNTVSGTVNSGGAAIRIGEARHTSGQRYSGYMDDFRITKGVARYTANFTPPAAEFFSTATTPDGYYDLGQRVVTTGGERGDAGGFRRVVRLVP